MVNRVVYIGLGIVLVGNIGVQMDNNEVLTSTPANGNDYSEAYRVIEKNFIFFEAGAITGLENEHPNTYLKRQDRFSAYLSPQEYQAFRISQQSHYGGIGAQLEVTESGEFICIPDAGSPAEQAGIRFGDVLLAVDGQPVRGKSLYVVGAMIRGEVGTSVELTLRGETRSYTVSIERTALRTDTVKVYREYAIPIISISSFKSNTRLDLRVALNVLEDTPYIILDLRGNSGGDLYSAIDCAMFFLEQDKTIATIQSRWKNTPQKSTNSPHISDLKVFIWQDARTASAAEVFTAALVQNGQAQSIGAKTYGKGIMQDIIELSDGSALILSTAYLKTPNNTLYHEQGLAPTYTLDSASPSVEQYLAKVEEPGETPVMAAVSSPTPEPTELPVPTPTTVPAIPTPTVKPVQEGPLQEYFICFDNEFERKDDATIRALAIQRSFNTVPDLYLLTRTTAASETFQICFGPLTSHDEAEQERKRIATGVNLPMSIQTVRPQPLALTPTATPTSPLFEPTPTPRPLPTKPDAMVQPQTGWGIVLGVFPYPEAQAFKRRLEHAPYELHVEITYIPGNLYRSGNLYRVLIGPYEEQVETFLQDLKVRGLVPNDAQWIKIQY